MKCCNKTVPVRGVLVVFGGILVHLTLGTQLTFGNTNPYFVSFIRKHSTPSDLAYVDGIWIQACMLMGQGVSMFLGGVLEHKLGPRLSCLVGSWFLSAGVLLTFWTIKVSYLTSVLTYGVMFGLGCGVAYPVPVTCAMRWFPGQRGLMGGLIFAGFGFGSTLFNQIITLYLNPHNVAPDLEIGEDIYFTQDEVLHRVPSLFLVLGGTYAAIQLIGVLLMVNPPPSYLASREEETTPKRSAEQQIVETFTIKTSVWSTGNAAYNLAADNSSIQTAHHLAAENSSIQTAHHLADDNSNIQTAHHSAADNSNIQRAHHSAADNSNIQTAHHSSPMATYTSTDHPIVTSDTFGRNQIPERENAVDMDVPPLTMLRNKQFYLIWLLFLFGGMGGVFMASMYKSYGQSFIRDDQFIAIVGSLAAVFNAIGGIFWGHLADRFGFNIAAKILYTLFACTSFTFIGSEFGLKPYFLVWVCLILFAMSGKFTVMPPVIARMFGNKYMSTNYGLLYTSQILTAAASAFMGEMLKDILHYSGLFFLIGSMSCVGFLITFFVKARTPDGKEI